MLLIMRAYRDFQYWFKFKLTIIKMVIIEIVSTYIQFDKPDI